MPSAKKRFGGREVRVGLLVVVAIGVLIFLILNASGDISPFSKKIHLRARFPNADGLRRGSEVRLAGVRIGKVDDVGLLAASGNELMEQLNKLSVPFTDIAGKINQGQGTIGRFVNDEAFYNNLNSTVRDVNDLVRRIQTGQGSEGQFVNDPALYNNLNNVSQSLQAISDDLRRGRGTAGKLLTDDALYNDARGSIARFNRSVDEINLIVADLRQGRGTAGKLLTDDAIYNDAHSAIARFNTAAERIDNVVAGVQRGEGTAGKLLTDDQLYNNVNQLSAETVKLIYDFRQNPKKYLTIKFELF